jgi:hypothetical protein
MDAMNFLGSLASIVGLAITLWVFFRVGRIEAGFRRQALLPLYSTSLGGHVKNLQRHLKNRNVSKMRSELAVCRSTLNDLIAYLKERRATDVKQVSLRISELLELRSDDALREQCSRILPSIQGVHETVKNLQHEINWRAPDV